MVNCCRSVSCVLAVLPEFARLQPGHLAGAPGDFPGPVGGAAGSGAGPNYLAITQGFDRLRFVCLWSGDGAGGTADMVREVTRRTGQVTWLDTSELW